MEPVDAERARQLSLFRPLGTVPLPCIEPLKDSIATPWRVHWFLVAAPGGKQDQVGGGTINLLVDL